MYVLLAGTSIVSKIQVYKTPINSAELQRLLLANERKQGDMIICAEHNTRQYVAIQSRNQIRPNS